MKTKRRLVFSPITRKWEIGNLATNATNGRKQWERDNSSWICYEGEEVSRAMLPPNPQPSDD
jgi:hypothetical protein